ncbi:VENN motif pre-toxin domain-containing protein [Salmonella enterica subsp. enterica]|nr:VENN motif pre-toxin domain-containing protein [Salmonella enterica subsp. enterica]
MGHAIIGGVVAELNGAPASGGAAGAVTGEVAAITISRLYFGKPPSELSESEREQLSGMSTVAAALAGSLASASSSGTVAGARAGNNAVENNALSLPKGMTETGQAATSWVKYAQDNNLSPEQVQAGLTDIVRGDLPESANIIKAILENNPGSDTVMALLSAEDAKDYALALLTSIPAEKALSLVGKGLKVIDNKILISAAEKISTAKGLQSATPRDLNEQILWKQVESNPANGIKFSDKGLNLNTDPRFPYSAGFEKMTATHELPNGSKIEIHYQYNSVTGKAYDMKIVSPQRTPANPSDVIDSIKENVR